MFPCPRSRLIIWSREWGSFGSPVPRQPGPIRGMCDAHRGHHEITILRDVRRTNLECGMRRGEGNIMWVGCVLDDLIGAFGINDDPWTTAAQEERGIVQDGGTRGGRIDHGRESQGRTTAC